VCLFYVIEYVSPKGWKFISFAFQNVFFPESVEWHELNFLFTLLLFKFPKRGISIDCQLKLIKYKEKFAQKNRVEILRLKVWNSESNRHFQSCQISFLILHLSHLFSTLSSCFVCGMIELFSYIFIFDSMKLYSRIITKS
jgi:hypothetical protein